jgi:hypothetical protein
MAGEIESLYHAGDDERVAGESTPYRRFPNVGRVSCGEGPPRGEPSNSGVCFYLPVLRDLLPRGSQQRKRPKRFAVCGLR